MSGGVVAEREARRRVRSARVAVRAAGVLAVLLLAGCTGGAAPPMEPLTATTLGAAEQRWAANGAASYRLVVRVRAPRFPVAEYEVMVEDGTSVAIRQAGRPLAPAAARQHDYSIAGLFALLRADLRLAAVPRIGDIPPVDLRAHFEPTTGRLVRYRRTVGSARRRVLLVEVLDYRPLAPLLAREHAR